MWNCWKKKFCEYPLQLHRQSHFLFENSSCKAKADSKSKLQTLFPNINREKHFGRYFSLFLCFYTFDSKCDCLQYLQSTTSSRNQHLSQLYRNLLDPPGVNFTNQSYGEQFKKLNCFFLITFLGNSLAFWNSCHTWAFVPRLYLPLVSWHSGSSSAYTNLILENFCHENLEEKLKVFIVLNNLSIFPNNKYSYHQRKTKKKLLYILYSRHSNFIISQNSNIVWLTIINR